METPWDGSERRACESVNAVRITELEKRLTLQSDAAKLAVTLAANDLRTRLEAMNEFRNALKDQAAQFVTRTEVDLHNQRFEDELRTLREFKAVLDAKASQRSLGISMLLSIVGLFFSLIALVFKHGP